MTIHPIYEFETDTKPLINGDQIFEKGVWPSQRLFSSSPLIPKLMSTEEELYFHFFNYQRVIVMMASVLLNLIIVSAIIFPKFILKQRKDFAITLYLFNFVIFVLCYVLSESDIGFGAGIGLFAVFTMLRFRSEMLNIQDMTYLLIVICIGFVNATISEVISFIEIILLNIGLCSLIYILDFNLAQPKLKCKKVKYGNLELIKPEKNIDLLKDLSIQTGLDILKVRIDSINLNEKIANVKVYYREVEAKNGVIKRNSLTWKNFAVIFKKGPILEKN